LEYTKLQGDSNMTGTDLCVNKPHFVPVIFEPPCIILPVVLHGCESLSPTLREVHRLRVCENRVLRIFGPKRDEVMESWRELHQELHNLYSLPSVIRMIKSRSMRRAGHVGRVGEILLGKAGETIEKTKT
jgi:hypothetical protein